MTEYTEAHHPVKIWAVRSARRLEMRGECSCTEKFRAPRMMALVDLMRAHALNATK